MTDETNRATRPFRSRDEFETDAPDASGAGASDASEAPAFAVTTTPFEARVVVGDDYEVVVRTPTLSAVVEETVADVVEDGWFETLELRLEDAHTVTQADASPPDIERDGDEVVCSVTVPWSERAADDALAVVEFVEGTWLQGVVPGYDYRDPARRLVERARQNYDDGSNADESGSVPL